MEKTDRGFNIDKFTDLYGAPCSVQESSLATQSAIWFGVEDTSHGGFQDYGRMHLSQHTVQHLLPTLQYFAEHGVLLGEKNEHVGR